MPDRSSRYSLTAVILLGLLQWRYPPPEPTKPSGRSKFPSQRLVQGQWSRQDGHEVRSARPDRLRAISSPTAITRRSHKMRSSRRTISFSFTRRVLQNLSSWVRGSMQVLPSRERRCYILAALRREEGRLYRSLPPTETRGGSSGEAPGERPSRLLKRSAVHLQPFPTCPCSQPDSCLSMPCVNVLLLQEDDGTDRDNEEKINEQPILDRQEGHVLRSHRRSLRNVASDAHADLAATEASQHQTRAAVLKVGSNARKF